ncbi:MAG: ABC transporter permease [Chloroflexi bacterium]|nr:ABC transporter permease [Chloroflexota bacterium]
MTTYIIRRIVLLIPTMIVVTLVTFLTVRFIPGNVVDAMIAQMSSAASMSNLNREALEKAMGLDVPIPIQYGRWLGIVPQDNGQLQGLLEGNLGKSLWGAQNVTDLIMARVPVSLELLVIAIVTALATSIPLGVYSAVKQDTAGDYVGRSVSILFVSVPSFWIATMIIVYPAIWWHWSPELTYIPFTTNPSGNVLQFLLPGFLMGILLGGTLMRITRTMMLEVLRQDYVRTAWAKGLAERRVITRHVLKNALIPVVTVIGIGVPIVLTASIVIEQIFDLPGIGLLLYQSLSNRDYPVISGINLFLATLVVVSNLLVDLSYAWLDPRVQYR